MLIDLTRLNNGLDSEIEITEFYSFSREELEGTDVSSADNIAITGSITLNAIGTVELAIDIKGILIIPCSVTLKPVEYPISITINTDLDELDGLVSVNHQNSLDILPIIWENILMEIPMRVVSEGAENLTLSGEGWKLVQEADRIENSELSKLKDLL